MERERILTVRGSSDQLLQYIRNQFEGESMLSYIADEKERSDAERCLYQGLTDALIRYNEGILSALASQETVVQTTLDNVKWVSNDGVHSISFSGSMKSLIDQLARSLPAFFFGWLTSQEYVFISTFLQAMVSALMDNINVLDNEEAYVYAICLDFTRVNKNKYFSVEDLCSHNEIINQGLETLNQFKVKHVSEEQIEKSCLALCEHKLLRHSGTRYKIIW